MQVRQYGIPLARLVVCQQRRGGTEAARLQLTQMVLCPRRGAHAWVADLSVASAGLVFGGLWRTSVLSPSYFTAKDISDVAPASASAFMLRITCSTTSAGPMQSAPTSSMPSGGGAALSSSLTAIRALRLAHSASSEDIMTRSAGAVHRSSGMPPPTVPTASAWVVAVHRPRARTRMGVRAGIGWRWVRPARLLFRSPCKFGRNTREVVQCKPRLPEP